MADLDLPALRALCERATPGPWRWFGNTKSYDIHLATVDNGRVFIMNFVRWGMGSAQPRFQGRGKQHGIMVPATDLVTYEVDYRRDIAGIAHPDAEFIAAARTALPALLEECERLRKERETCDGSCDIALARRQVGPDALVPGNARECAEAWERESARLKACTRDAEAEVERLHREMEDRVQSAVRLGLKAAETRATLAREAGFREGVEAAIKALPCDISVSAPCSLDAVAPCESCASRRRMIRSLPPPPTTPASGNEKKED